MTRVYRALSRIHDAIGRLLAVMEAAESALREGDVRRYEPAGGTTWRCPCGKPATVRMDAREGSGWYRCLSCAAARRGQA